MQQLKAADATTAAGLKVITDCVLQWLEALDPRLSRCMLCRLGLPQLPVSCTVLGGRMQYVCLFCASRCGSCPMCPPTRAGCTFVRDVAQYIDEKQHLTEPTVGGTGGGVCPRCRLRPLSLWPSECNACHTAAAAFSSSVAAAVVPSDTTPPLTMRGKNKRRLRSPSPDPLVQALSPIEPQSHQQKKKQKTNNQSPISIVPEIMRAEQPLLSVPEYQQRLQLPSITAAAATATAVSDDLSSLTVAALEARIATLSRRSTANRFGAFSLKCQLAPLLTQHKLAYTGSGSVPWHRFVAPYTTEPFHLLVLRDILYRHPSVQQLDVGRWPWRSFRADLAELCNALDALQRDQPDVYRTRWISPPPHASV